VTVRYAVLAYGSQDSIHRQASMLVLSLLAHAPQPREIVVITDRPDRYAWFADVLRIRVLVPGELQTWRGEHQFSMRQKILAARQVIPRDGALTLLDADTLAIANLQPLVDALAAGSLFMHKREFDLAASPRAGNRKLWTQLEGKTFDRWQFRAGDAMWNSGVLALPSASAGLLDDALALYDAMAAAGIRHFATEQLVVGLVFSRTGRLRSAEQWFTHYWGNKQSFDAEIARRLDDAHRRHLTPAAAADALRASPIDLPSESRPGRVEKLRRWFRGR
jgi:hypothetical protein